MIEKKTFAVAQVKVAESDNANGEFEVILSAETLDRDGEVIDKGAFDPLPDSIPFHAFHDFHDPIGRGAPFYDEGVLKARGVFASTTRAQEIRTLVSEGVIGHTSVGFMAAVRKGEDDDPPHVTSGELLEGSFVSVPSNREAAVLMAKEFQAKAEGDPPEDPAGDTPPDSDWQKIHDLALANGATCPDTDEEEATTAPETPASEEAGKSPASNAVEAMRLMARASLL